MKKVFLTLGCFLKVSSGSVETIMYQIVSILSFIINKTYDRFFSGDFFVGTQDETAFIKLF